MKLFLLNTMEN
jgi:hypothetical protein